MSISERFLGLFNGINIGFKCLILGRPLPKAFGLIAWHNKQAVISDKQFMTAYIKACDTMLERGFTVKRYEIREFSCGVFAMQMASLIAQNLACDNEFNLAAPIQLISYDRDKDKAGHVRLAITHGGTKYYYEPYAEQKYRGAKPMSTKELDGAGIIQV